MCTCGPEQDRNKLYFHSFIILSKQTDEELGLLNLITMNLHRIGARNSPKQAKNEIIQKI